MMQKFSHITDDEETLPWRSGGCNRPAALLLSGESGHVSDGQSVGQYA